MSLTGTTIYTHGFGNGAYPSLKRRAEMRKTCGPYQWTVPSPDNAKVREGRGYYAADDDGTPSARDSTFVLRSVARPRHAASYYVHEQACSEYVYPVVLRLSRSRGFLAGYTLGAGMSSAVSTDIHDDEADAWRAAKSECERYASEETEYQGQHANDEE